MKQVIYTLYRMVSTLTKCDNGKLSKVIEYKSGARVEIPINRDGSVKWFDDSKLLKKSAKIER